MGESLSVWHNRSMGNIGSGVGSGDRVDPAKFERYQAEALIHRHLPISGLLGIVCHTDNMRQAIERQLQARNLELRVHARTGWYF